MNDNQTTQPANNPVSQDGGQAAPDPMSDFSLGASPSDPQNKSSGGDDKEKALVDTTQTIDHSTGDAPQSSTDTNKDELESIRRDALSQLSPLLGKLDQPPEEKYHTLLMMIQSSDNKSLIKEAYDAANQIEDEAKKAQALLGIINEINYFSKKELANQSGN